MPPGRESYNLDVLWARFAVNPGLERNHRVREPSPGYCVPSTAAEVGKFIVDETEKWGKVVESSDGPD